MKNVLLILFIGSLLCACDSQENVRWEYKVLKFGEEESLFSHGSDDFFPKSLYDPVPQLNQLGEEGWELVSTFTTTETVFPNFGNKEYVTGIRENTRTRTINFVLKRQIRGNRTPATSAQPVEDPAMECVVEEEAVAVEPIEGE